MWTDRGKVQHQEVFKAQVSNPIIQSLLRQFTKNNAPVSLMVEVTSRKALKTTHAAMKVQMERLGSTLDAIETEHDYVYDIIQCTHAITSEAIRGGAPFVGQESVEVRMEYCVAEMLRFAGRVSGIPGADRMRGVLEELLEEARNKVIAELQTTKAARNAVSTVR